MRRHLQRHAHPCEGDWLIILHGPDFHFQPESTANALMAPISLPVMTEKDPLLREKLRMS
jgi:hypothetical protein